MAKPHLCQLGKQMHFYIAASEPPLVTSSFLWPTEHTLHLGMRLVAWLAVNGGAVVASGSGSASAAVAGGSVRLGLL